MKGALGNSLESKRLERWMNLLGNMRPEDAAGIAALLHEESLAGREFKTENMLFWQTWASLDVDGAWDYLQQNMEMFHDKGASSLAKAWAVKDPSAAENAFMKLEKSPFKEEMLNGLAHGLAETDPSRATDLTTRLPSEFQRSVGISISGSLLGQLGYEKTQEWFDQLPAEVEPLQKETMHVLLETLYQKEPGSVEKFALSRLDQAWVSRPEEQAFIVSMIMRNGSEPWKYISAVTQKRPNPEDPLRLPSMIAAYQPQQTIAWIDANPNDPSLDQMLAGTAKALIEKNGGDTEESAALLARIKNQSIRDLVKH